MPAERPSVARIPIALTIAGSDSGGGAGIQADLRTFAALEVHGLTAITALTAQSSVEVRAVWAAPAEMLDAQIETVAADFPIAAAKTGMLWRPDLVDVAVRAIERHTFPTVVDPVLAAESGGVLATGDLAARLTAALFPLARLVTPNLDEIEVFTGRRPTDTTTLIDAARRLRDAGARAVLAKGGHLPGRPIDVLLLEDDRVRVLDAARIDTRWTHGTGCTYAAAITAWMARGLELEHAVERAHAFVQRALAAAPRTYTPGRGSGPVHQMFAHHRWPGS